MVRFSFSQRWVWPIVMAGCCVLSGSLPTFGSDGPEIVCIPGRPSSSATRQKTAAPANKTVTDRPDWSEIEKSVQTTLAENTAYRPGDLLTQDDAAKIFQALKTKGWEVKSTKDLTDRMLSSSDEMVRLLREKKAVNFRREIAGVPGGYDRLDKLRNLPNGSRRLRELIQQPGGHTLIEYMATTPGGRRMGRELSTRKRGDFNKPNNRIYTEADLLAALKLIYAAETAASAPQTKR